MWNNSKLQAASLQEDWWQLRRKNLRTTIFMNNQQWSCLLDSISSSMEIFVGYKFYDQTITLRMSLWPTNVTIDIDLKGVCMSHKIEDSESDFSCVRCVFRCKRAFSWIYIVWHHFALMTTNVIQKWVPSETNFSQPWSAGFWSLKKCTNNKQNLGLTL